MSCLDDIHEAATKLTSPRRHSEPRWGWDKHRHRIIVGHHDTDQPSLIQQLRVSSHPTRGGDRTNRRTSPGSRPPVNIMAVSVLACVVQDGLATLNRLLPPSSHHPGPSGHLGREERVIWWLVRAASTAGNSDQVEVRAMMRSWVRWAEIVTGWRTPPQEIKIPCPSCESTGTLKAFAQTTSAKCLACGTRWSPDAIGVLAAVAQAHRDSEAAEREVMRMRRAEAK